MPMTFSVVGEVVSCEKKGDKAHVVKVKGAPAEMVTFFPADLGSYVVIVGLVKLRKYEFNGQERSKLEFIASRVEKV